MLFNLFNKKQKSEEGKPDRYHELTVKEVVRETPEAITIVFEKPARQMDYEPGQFLTLIIPVDGKEVRRSYSLCSSPLTEAHPAVTVKRVASGSVSNYLNDTLKPGNKVRVMEPMGNFTTNLDVANERHVVMFGGGSGITPLMSLIKALLHVEPKSQVSLIYANRHKESIIFRQQLHDLQAQHPERFQVRHVLEDASAEIECQPGMISAALLPDLLSNLAFHEPVSDYFICGPQGMMAEVTQGLHTLNIPTHQIHKESFVSGSADKAAKALATEETENKAPTATWDTSSSPGAYNTNKEQTSETHEVTVIYDGETYKFAVDPQSSILQTALALDIDLPYSCQSGMCTACMGKCTSGRIKLDDDDSLTQDDLKQGFVLTCVGHPLTSDVVIEIE